MDALKFLLTLVILAILGATHGEEEHNHRKGKCGHSTPMKSGNKPRNNFRKNVPNRGNSINNIEPPRYPPIPVFNNDYQPPINEPAEPLPEPEQELDVRGDYQPPKRSYPTRLRISEDGDISFGRSLNFGKVRTFHADDQADKEATSQHTSEDADAYHKIRTARNSPQQLSSTLGTMQSEGTQTLNDVSAGNSAHAGDYFNLDASGLNVSATHTGNSVASGQGTVSVSGSTTNSVVSPGWDGSHLLKIRAQIFHF